MQIKSLVSPRGAFNHVTTFVGGKYTDGTLLDYDAAYVEFEANAAVTRGSPVIFVVPTATVPLRVAVTAAAPVGLTIRGVAMNNAAVGQIVLACCHGYCEAWVDAAPTAAAAFGTVAIASTSEAARLDSAAAATIAATHILGDLIGFYLGAIAADGRAPFWFEHF